ncbi:MAG: SDR family NAD(P)-dependent oxidoreductase [Candidatus Krumholzibacteria bacterium]|nr:SDR family NAD(P)-dependent oxidoreductase [Candidatus Krumholzibacteria bacterium]MDH4336229.1 SDR family NAD(P)-dependent oxidoreductase [Candidatus Krumholzibacteria bacterium]MDH5268870.1 SDR family NAD(P)-dependent oxidoreductase [Candidatus Krumholzibacteria bacterium]MDH5628424.1 SDR family NAD(P)-dependent oxidoreductase [Candidatus Krumholzibacteria bacterium]
MNRLEGKNVVITGASAGFGEACARHFAAHGSHLELWARRLDRLERVRAELEDRHGKPVSIRVVDVRARDVVSAAAAELRERGWIPDVLVNNAGLASGFDPIQEGDYEDWDAMIDTNLKGLLNVTREILPMMVERDAGHVINIGSVAGYMAYPKGNVYNATKFAVRGLTEAMAVDLFGTNVRVSSVDPGAAETEFSLVRFHGDDGRASKVYDGFQPLSAEDIADAVVYVANAPAHVNIAKLVMLPTAQRNPYLIHRKG